MSSLSAAQALRSICSWSWASTLRRVRLLVRRRSFDLALTRLPFSSTLLHWWSWYLWWGWHELSSSICQRHHRVVPSCRFQLGKVAPGVKIWRVSFFQWSFITIDLVRELGVLVIQGVEGVLIIVGLLALFRPIVIGFSLIPLLVDIVLHVGLVHLVDLLSVVVIATVVPSSIGFALPSRGSVDRLALVVLSQEEIHSIHHLGIGQLGVLAQDQLLLLMGQPGATQKDPSADFVRALNSILLDFAQGFTVVSHVNQQGLIWLPRSPVEELFKCPWHLHILVISERCVQLGQDEVKGALFLGQDGVHLWLQLSPSHSMKAR